MSQRIDWSTLLQVPTEQVGEWFDKRIGDVLFQARLKGKPRPVFIEVMLEHQSESQHLMPLRILGMVVRRYETLLRNASTAPQRLPVVLPVVLFQGESDGRSWRHTRRLRDLLDADDDTLRGRSTTCTRARSRLWRTPRCARFATRAPTRGCCKTSRLHAK